jgi:2OG-Fe(II) oxygenase superfamily
MSVILYVKLTYNKVVVMNACTKVQVPKQLSQTAHEIFTVDDVFDEQQISEWNDLVMHACLLGSRRERTFSPSDFKNGKKLDPVTSHKIYDCISCVLPEVYVTSGGERWEFLRATDYIMYAEIACGQQFGIHTDTGCEFLEQGRVRSKFTVLIYLNEDFDGGKTRFFDDSFQETVAVHPKTGRSLVFDIDRFHCGDVIERGVKRWIGTEIVARYLDE